MLLLLLVKCFTILFSPSSIFNESHAIEMFLKSIHRVWFHQGIRNRPSTSMTEDLWGKSRDYVNRTVLRMAKTHCRFDHSECSKVQMSV